VAESLITSSDDPALGPRTGQAVPAISPSNFNCYQDLASRKISISGKPCKRGTKNETDSGRKGVYTRRAPLNRIPQEPLDFKLTKESNMRRRRRRSVSNPPALFPPLVVTRPVATSNNPSRAWEKAWGGNYKGGFGGRQDGV